MARRGPRRLRKRSRIAGRPRPYRPRRGAGSVGRPPGSGDGPYPLQVVILRHSADDEGVPFENAVERAFQGGTTIGGYLASGEDLGVEVRKFHATPELQIGVSDFLDSVCHTLVVAIVDTAALNDNAFLDWLVQCWNYIRPSGGRHRLLLLPLDERVGRRLSELRPPLGTNQQMTPQQLGEQAIRPAMFSLRALHEARVALAAGLGLGTPQQPAGSLQLFISHAKADGLPLASALKHLIDEVRWLKSFYDAQDIPGGSDWQHELEVGVASSLLVVLRTDAYDERWWCQQEALWCEKYATPAVLVDARPGLAYPAGVLPLDRVPSVRISDGNLLRILFAALREGLRYLLFQRRVRGMSAAGYLPAADRLRVFSYPPSMPALLRVCEELSADLQPPIGQVVILYPDPPLRTGLYEAAQALIATRAPGTLLTTPETLAANPIA